MKRVLIVSPYFPPSTLAGVHRARLLAKHLPAAGWRPTIVCVHERWHEEKIDPELAELLPADLEVIKTGALAARWSRLAGIGDLGLRAFLHLRTSIRRLLDTRSIDLVFITGSPYYPMLLSRWIKRGYGKPVVLDFQDPWVSKYGTAQRRFSKAGFVHWLATRLEPCALRFADFVTSVSDLQNAEMTLRYPWLNAERMAAIPIGGDSDDFTYLKTSDRPCPWMPPTTNGFTISYVGNVWPAAYRTLEALFAAVAQLKHRTPSLYARLRLVFVGSSNRSIASTDEVVMPFARRAGIAEIVSETPQRIPYLDALNVMARSDALLLLGSHEPHYTASKLYPTLLADRLVFGIFHARSNLCSIAEAVGGVMLVRFDDENPVESKTEGIISSLAALLAGNANIRKVDHSKLEPYLGPAIARRFAQVFDSVQNADAGLRLGKSSTRGDCSLARSS